MLQGIALAASTCCITLALGAAGMLPQSGGVSTAKGCSPSAPSRLFYFRLKSTDQSIVRLPLEHPAKASSLGRGIFAITTRGAAIPLARDRVFVRPMPDPRSRYAEDPPTGPEFGDEPDEILSSYERATAQYTAATAIEGDIAFLSRTPEEKAKFYQVTEIHDDSLRRRIERRLNPARRSGIIPNNVTDWACGDKPNVRTFRFHTDTASFVYFESDCTNSGADSTGGARFLALYKEDKGSLEPWFVSSQATDTPFSGDSFIRINPLFVADLNGDGRIATRLEREGPVSGDTFVVEFHRGGYKRLQLVQVNEEGMGPLATFADPFLKCR